MKKGQFYLVTTIVIITILVGFASLENVVQNKSSIKFYQYGEELRLETEKILDYIAKQNIGDQEGLNLLLNFTKDYINYSEADNFYFVFGDNDSAIFSGYQKLKGGTVNIETESETMQIELIERNYQNETLNQPGDSVNITIPGDVGEELTFEFLVRDGENFFFIISKEINEDRYLETNGFSRESEG